MNRYVMPAMIAISLALVACGDGTSRESSVEQDAPFIVMDESLAELRADFNAATGSVRLVFISGPTCGICLRGLADLNRELLGKNRDPRLRTFVVHVPTLDAGEQDARNSTVLIDNPYTRHYWEDTGIIGKHYQEVLDIDYYAWDVWFIYGPDAKWERRLPPEPDFWMHQLAPLPDETYLDAEVFAAHTSELLAQLPPANPGSTQVAVRDDAPVEVKSVAQPRGVALEQHISGRGGYRNLSAIEELSMEGTITTANGTEPLAIAARADGTITRTVGEGDAATVASRRGEQVHQPPADADRGLPWTMERELMESFEITGPLVDWKAKGHRVGKRMDMVRVDGELAWELDVEQSTGHRWRTYVDSHTGMERRRVLLDDAGEPVLEIRFDDYRIAEPDTPYPSRFGTRRHHTMRGFYGVPGYVFPYRVEYRDGNGELLAAETFRYIDVSYRDEAS